MADNKPTFRIIAKLTNARNERFENIGVAWANKKDTGETIITLRFSPFLDGSRLPVADSVLLVPFANDRRERAQAGSGQQPPVDDAPMPDDEGW